MRNPFKRGTDDECKHAGYCNCGAVGKGLNCMTCRFYRMIDSGYGYCIALPTVVVVPWCKDVCSLFKERGSQSVP